MLLHCGKDSHNRNGNDPLPRQTETPYLISAFLHLFLNVQIISVHMITGMLIHLIHDFFSSEKELNQQFNNQLFKIVKLLRK